MEVNTLESQPDLEVKEFFDILSQTSSILAKKKLLTERRGDMNVRKFLDYLLNPFFVTGISEKKISKFSTKEPTVFFTSFHELMSYVRENHTGSDEVLANVQAFLNGYNTAPWERSSLYDFYVGIITKSIRIGCDVKTVNDALGFELIPMWEVQQAYQINKVKLNDNEWFSLSQKLNGVRGTFFEGKLISRQGKEFVGLDHILMDISKLLQNSEMWVLDGELIRKNTDGIPDNENFRLTAGIINQEDGDKSSIQFVIFDILPKDEFLRGESQLTYIDRIDELLYLATEIRESNLKSLEIVRFLYNGTDKSMIDIFLEQMVSEGKEGLMVNRNCKYFRKRHNGILKVKRFYTVDLQVIDVEEGTGRLSGTLGAFVVRYKDNILNVGSGMTDEQRHEFWEKRESLIGRIIEVKYKEESRDKESGRPSLQFPIFVQLRELGKQESYD
jgi:DNA ligase-1